MQSRTALEVQRIGSQQLSVVPAEKHQLLKDTYCKGASDTEFELFVDACNRTQLDPFAKQIFAVPRYDSKLKRDVYAFQVSIDGLRLIAERTGKYEGQTKPEWCGKDGVWKELWLEDTPPFAARIGVYKHGHKEPTYGIVKYSAFAQIKQDGTPIAMWKRMPDHMLLKCAEAQALRKVFPQDLSGLYTAEEMAYDEKQVNATEISRQPLTPAKPKTREQMTPRERATDDIRGYIAALRALGDDMFIADTQEARQAQVLTAIHAIALERDWQYQTIGALRDLKNEQVDEFAGWLEGRINELQEKALDAQESDEIPI